MDPIDDGLRRRIIRLVSQVLGPQVALPDSFPITQQLSDLGITSLKIVNLMLAIETEFDLEIPHASITPATFSSVASIASMLVTLLP